MYDISFNDTNCHFEQDVDSPFYQEPNNLLLHTLQVIMIYLISIWYN